MIFPHRAVVPVLALGLTGMSGCASVNPAGLARLASVNPMTADPRQILVAARLPEVLKLRTGDLVMEVKTSRDGAPGAINETFLLAVEDAPAGAAGQVAAQDGERLQIARVAAQDVERLRATQARALALKATGDGREKGSLTVGAKGGCRTAELDGRPLRLNLFMQVEAAGDWFPVVSALDLAKALGAETLAKIPPC